jgi:hypothetical protein
MEMQLFTVHTHPRADGIEVVGEPGWLAAVPPLWALYEGLWLTLAAQIAALAAIAWLAPLGVGFVYVAFVLIAVFDGNAVQRFELRLRGWREVACVEARTAEGAEELYLTGQAG